MLSINLPVKNDPPLHLKEVNVIAATIAYLLNKTITGFDVQVEATRIPMLGATRKMYLAGVRPCSPASLIATNLFVLLPAGDVEVIDHLSEIMLVSDDITPEEADVLEALCLFVAFKEAGNANSLPTAFAAMGTRVDALRNAGIKSEDAFVAYAASLCGALGKHFQNYGVGYRDLLMIL